MDDHTLMVNNRTKPRGISKLSPQSELEHSNLYAKTCRDFDRIEVVIPSQGQTISEITVAIPSSTKCDCPEAWVFAGSCMCLAYKVSGHVCLDYMCV